MMKKFATILVLLTILLKVSDGGRVVCYFPSWAIYIPDNGKFQAKNIDPNICTHVIYSYIGLNPNGAVLILDDWEHTLLEEVAHLMGLKDVNPDLKVLACMGGWNENSAIYSQVSAHPEKRSTMVQSVLTYLQKYGYDGFALDWEFPGQRGGDSDKDSSNFVTLLKELKTALNAEGLTLSAGVSATPESMNISYPDVKAISDNLDQINILSFDDGYSAGISNVDGDIKRWLDGGADPRKLNIGGSTYGRSFNASEATGTLGYNKICQFDSDWKYVWDDKLQVPNKIKDDQKIVYEDAKSLGIKADVAIEYNLGGVAVWSVSTDDFLGLCGDSYPLITSLYNHLN